MELDRWELYRALGYEREIESPDYGKRSYPVPEVRAFHSSPARIKIAYAPARAGKSFSAAHDVLPDILEPLFTGDHSRERKHLIAGPEYEHASKEFGYVCDALIHQKEKIGIPGPTRYIHQPKLGRLEVYWKEFNTRLVGKSAKHTQSLLGDQWVTVILSEASQMEARVWRQGLSTRYGRTIWPTTPSVKGRWITEFHAEAQIQQDANVQLFNFPPWANPYYDKKTFDEALARYGMKDPFFREQFLGDPNVWYGGRVFPVFQPEPVEDVNEFVTTRGIEGGEGSHCIKPILVPDGWLRLAGIDFGWRDPTVFLFIAISPQGDVVVFDEYEQAQASMGEHIDRIRQLAENNGTKWPLRVYREAKGQSKQIATDAAMDHRFATIPMNSDRVAGRLRIQEYLAKGEAGFPRLRIVKQRCPRLVKEMTELHYDELSTLHEGQQERWLGDDHAVDALKYALLSRPSTKVLPELKRFRQPTLDEMMKRRRRKLQDKNLIGGHRNAQM